MKQTKISKSARGMQCTARITGTCNHDPATTVLAHAPYIGRYGSRKQWWWSAYLCSSCHDELDNRGNHPMTDAQMKVIWFDAVHETQQHLFADNYLKVV